MARTYSKSRRAESEQATRDRIVEATVALHEELGPRFTSISAIAEKAGVQRLTVYRHFPDDVALFAACTSCWLEAHPLPDPTRWAAEPDGFKRCRTALTELYAYFEATQGMWRVSFRDGPFVPALAGPMAAIGEGFGGMAGVLIEGFPKAAPGLAATVRHLVAFPTWDDLNGQGLDAAAKVALAMTWIQATAKSSDR